MTNSGLLTFGTGSGSTLGIVALVLGISDVDALLDTLVLEVVWFTDVVVLVLGSVIIGSLISSGSVISVIVLFTPESSVSFDEVDVTVSLVHL